jgi:hypothetical protein
LGFIFHPWVHPKSEITSKNLKPENNLKKPEIQKTPERNSRKKPIETQKPPEGNTFTKPDGHPNPTQNPTGSGASCHPWVRILVSNSTRLHFFAGRVFGQSDPNPTHCHP